MKYSEKQYLQSLTKDQQLDIMNVDFFSERELRVITIDNGYVLPAQYAKRDANSWFIGGVADNKKEYVKESGQYAYGERNRITEGYSFNADNVPYINEEVIYFNYYISQWGHFLLDVIGRLWYVLNNDKLKIVYAIGLDGSDVIKGNFLALLKLLGIAEDRILFINKVTRFKKIIIPETSILVAKYYTKEYKQIIDKVIDNALYGYKLKTGRKIYCSRRSFKDKKSFEIGEGCIEKVYRDNNYEIVHMEDLNLVEQIRLLNECEEVVCISGTLVHNAMFIRNKNCNFTVLNKTYKINPNIYLTNQLSSCNFRFVDVYLSPLPISIGKGPFIITINDDFTQYCKDNNLTIQMTTKVGFIARIKYYFVYFMKYRKRILRHKKISYAGFEKYDVNYIDIKKHYLKQLKLINK